VDILDSTLEDMENIIPRACISGHRTLSVTIGIAFPHVCLLFFIAFVYMYVSVCTIELLPLGVINDHDDN